MTSAQQYSQLASESLDPGIRREYERLAREAEPTPAPATLEYLRGLELHGDPLLGGWRRDMADAARAERERITAPRPPAPSAAELAAAADRAAQVADVLRVGPNREAAEAGRRRAEAASQAAAVARTAEATASRGHHLKR